jgi:hypothetical protein
VGILGFSGCFLMMVCGYFGIFRMFFDDGVWVFWDFQDVF